MSYRKAPLATLDALSFRDTPTFYNFLRKANRVDGAMILQTCNRIELFFDAKVPSQIRSDILREWALESKFKLGELTKLVEAREGRSVIRYLVRLATGLESMLIGENQIIGQLKNSLTEALSNSSASALLEDTVHRAISAGSAIREQTGIGRGTVSLGSAAMKLAEETLGKLQDSHVLLLGAGQAGMLVMKALKARGVSNITVASRTVHRTRSFCRTFGGTPLEFQAVPSQLAKTDLVIVATRSSNHVLTKDSFSYRDSNMGKLMILDLSNPRNVDPNVSDLENVIFRTIDDLRGIADDALAKRKELVKKAEALVGPRVEKITALVQREEAEPIVSDIYRRADQIRKEVLNKTLSRLDLTVEQRESLRNMTVSLVEKLLDGPVVNLRRAAERRDERVLTAAGQIFRGE
ncbi:MAG TPA: glutamyl-tRNA reductase [Candidatus Angelobacter sp.]|nr:glutamyl-tRNA reductase [Candidatus Angelobacter sp.]